MTLSSLADNLADKVHDRWKLGKMVNPVRGFIDATAAAFALVGAGVLWFAGAGDLPHRLSLLVFGIYYMSLIGGETLGDRGIIAPFWGPWGPNIIFLAIALWGLSRIGRETSTTRGGGWDDLWMTVRGMFFRRRRRRRRAATLAPEA